MIQVAAPHDGPITLKFPSLAERNGLVDHGELLTLRAYYEAVLLPELLEESEEDDSISPRSLAEDRVAINNWERYTANRPLCELSDIDLRELRSGMLNAGRSTATVSKTWRELRAICKAACDDGHLPSVPKLKRKTRIVTVKTSRQREILTAAEASSLWRECRKATYPANNPPGLEAAKLWRVALMLFWMYGARTRDVFNLRWSDVRFGDRLIQFEAMKTGKLQGLPLTELVEAHLRSVKTQYNREFVLPGFLTTGHYNARRKRWKPGYYATWRGEITAAATLTAPVYLKNFRQRVVNDYNALFPSIKLGSWIAGHSVPGVSAMNYELPTQAVRDAIAAAPVPECFREIG